MEKKIVTTGKTMDLAIEAALTQLGLTRDDVSVEVLAQAKPGFLGFGATPAKVQVTYEAPDLTPAEPGRISFATKSKPFLKRQARRLWMQPTIMPRDMLRSSMQQRPREKQLMSASKSQRQQATASIPSECP